MREDELSFLLNKLRMTHIKRQRNLKIFQLDNQHKESSHVFLCKNDFFI